MIKLRVFVSSVQNELAAERRAVKTLVTSDPFLDEHCVPILYEDEYSYRDGHLVVTFRGPGKAIRKLKAEQAVAVFEVQPSVAETLNPNQRTILRELLAKDQVQVPELASALGVTAQAVRKDLSKLQKLGLVAKRGAARATYYVLKERKVAP